MSLRSATFLGAGLVAGLLLAGLSWTQDTSDRELVSLSRLTPKWKPGEWFLLTITHDITDSHRPEWNRNNTDFIAVEIVAENPKFALIAWTVASSANPNRDTSLDTKLEFMLDHQTHELKLTNGEVLMKRFPAMADTRLAARAFDAPGFDNLLALPGWQPPLSRPSYWVSLAVADAAMYFSFEDRDFGSTKKPIRRRVSLVTDETRESPGIDLTLNAVLEGTSKLEIAKREPEQEIVSSLSRRYDRHSLDGVLRELLPPAQFAILDSSALPSASDDEALPDMCEDISATSEVRRGYPRRLRAIERITLANGWTRVHQRDFEIHIY
jgi:hypothetical protein